MNARQPFAVSTLSIIMALSLAACGSGIGQHAGAGGMPPPEVDVLTVASSNATVTRDLPGRLQAWRTAEIRARVDGVIEKRTFTEGSDVKAGAQLFLIDPRSYKAAADAAKGDMALAKVTLERYKPLLEMRAVSKQEYDQAEAKLKQAEAALAQANIDLENTRVPAPIDGRIGRALVTEGALANKNAATPLATIEQIDKLYVNFTETNTELLQLKHQLNNGSVKRSDSVNVQIVLEDDSLYPLPGKLLFSDLAVDPDTGAVNLRAELPNPKKELLPGMFVRVRFPQAIMDNVIIVPQRAVLSNTEGQYVMIVDSAGKVSVRPIKTVAMSGSNWIVDGGLKAGDIIIVDGLQKTRPGGTVKPHELSAAEALAPAGMDAPTPPAAQDKKAAPASESAKKED